MKALPFEAQEAWVSEGFYIGGEEYFERIRQEIDRAKKTIDVEVYIFELGSLGRDIAMRLVQAAQRGVRVRVIVDRIGTLGWIDDLESVFLNSGVYFKTYHPFFAPVFIFSWLSYINQRNHRKTWIFDDRIVGVSSCNIADDHMRSLKREEAWIDYGLVIEDPRNITFCNEFEKVWADGYNRRKRSDLLSLLSLARQRIWIGTPYFVPTLRQLRLLLHKRRRNIEVNILISRKSDVFFMPWLMTSYYAILLRAGIGVYQYDRQVFHGKVIVVDDWYRIGTSNFNHRSLLHDLETDVMVTHTENQRRLQNHLIESFAASELLTRKQLESESIFKKLITKVIFLFKWWF